MGETLGGAAIRAYETARALTRVADVVLAAPGTQPPGLAPARHEPYELGDPRPLRDLIRAADVVISRPASPLVASWLRGSSARIVYDLYDPLALDFLEAQVSAPRIQQLVWNTVALDHFLGALHTGHHFICGGDRQRDLYLGAMLGSRLISPAAYSRDPSFRSFIDTVPFGIPDERPERVPGAGPRARFPQLGDDAEIVLWNGGIWNWLDPVTAVRAVVAAAEKRPNVRLVFMRAALTEGPEARVARAAHELAAQLGVLDRLVFFNDDVVSYAERASWLLDADCMISTHLDHLEAHFSFRTRLLDSFWVGTPAAATSGDELSELIERRDLGVTFPPSDVEAAAAGIVRVLERGRSEYADRLAATGAELTWSRAVAALEGFVTATGTPVALGDPLARRVSSPLHSARATGIRLARSLGLARRG